MAIGAAIDPICVGLVEANPSQSNLPNGTFKKRGKSQKRFPNEAGKPASPDIVSYIKASRSLLSYFISRRIFAAFSAARQR